MQLRKWGVLLLGLALGLGSAHSALAQVTTIGTIEVVLEDPQGGRLPGVSVTASAPDVITTRTVVSDAQGVATLEALAPSAQYTVKAMLSGFRDFSQSNILVRTGQTTSIHAQLSLATVSEQVEVQGLATPVVDVKRSISGQDITLQLTESLPTGRSYQSYLQLVPGVLPDSQLSSGNPASRSGMNWKDAITNDNLGLSPENVYYFEGINTTDPVTGTFGANLNTEIIQEQKVITGGIPAEYVGTGGLVSTVITKSGSNTYHGSLNEFFQNDNLVAQDKHLESSKFKSYDTAFTIGGPVVTNKIWGFGSFRYIPTTRDVSSQDTHTFLRTSKTTGKQGFAKGTWAASANDMISFMFLNDPQTRDADTDPTVPNNRVQTRQQGGNNYSGTYNRIWGSRLLVEAAANFHDAELSIFSAQKTARNTIAFQTTDVRTLADEQLGGYGTDSPETRPSKSVSASAQYQWQQHRFKGGFEFAKNEDHRTFTYTGADKAQFTSISNRYVGAGVTADNIASGPWSTKQFKSNVASDFNGLIATINTLPNKAAFYSAYDLDKDGTITSTEFGQAAVFNSTAGNPDGNINYYRVQLVAEGPQDYESRGLAFFGQDEFSYNRLTVNAGLRTERMAHYSTTGAQIFQFPWTWAPRLSAAYDLTGNGRQKVSAYWGRYYSPIRIDMTQFAGSATGATREEQVYVLGQWVNYRTRGGAIADAYFSPSTKTPYTDELQFQHEMDLGNGMSFSSTYYHRQVRDIFEDFDPALYTEPSAYPGSTTASDTLFLGWPYFGWSPTLCGTTGADANCHPSANFFLGTLPGGQRNYHGLEFVGRKRFSDQWQALSSYSYIHSAGNAVSVGNADFAGDVLFLDPRSPNLYGVVPGTIHHLFKAGGSYTTKWGIELGLGYRWNSGTIVNKTQLLSQRRLPIEGDNTACCGITSADVASQIGGWVAKGAVGATQNPSWGQLDLRVQYIAHINRMTTEFFVDIFNLNNDQAAVRLEDLAAGTGTTTYGSEIQWVGPRRAFLGARISF